MQPSKKEKLDEWQEGLWERFKEDERPIGMPSHVEVKLTELEMARVCIAMLHHLENIESSFSRLENNINEIKQITQQIYDNP